MNCSLQVFHRVILVVTSVAYCDSDDLQFWRQICFLSWSSVFVTTGLWRNKSCAGLSLQFSTTLLPVPEGNCSRRCVACKSNSPVNWKDNKLSRKDVNLDFLVNCVFTTWSIFSLPSIVDPSHRRKTTSTSIPSISEEP
jgi:hypothetical protein